MAVDSELKNALENLTMSELREARDFAEELLRKRAIEELERHQIKENELRELAGLKKKPVRPAKAKSKRK